MRRGVILWMVLALGLVLGAAMTFVLRSASSFGDGPDPVSVADASLVAMQEQARLTPFSAQFVAVVTSRQQRFGLAAERTLIMPGTVRYELDLARLGRRDLAWDAATRTLRVTLPPLQLSRPQVDVARMRQYGPNSLLTRLTSAEERLEAANLQAGQRELIRQARQPLPTRLARDAAKQAVARSFALPLQAAGVDARVEARFADEPVRDPSVLDRSRSIEEVLAERR